MAGKSTYMRQVALITVMRTSRSLSREGSADPIVDRIFTVWARRMIWPADSLLSWLK